MSGGKGDDAGDLRKKASDPNLSGQIWIPKPKKPLDPRALPNSVDGQSEGKGKSVIQAPGGGGSDAAKLVGDLTLAGKEGDRGKSSNIATDEREPKILKPNKPGSWAALMGHQKENYVVSTEPTTQDVAKTRVENDSAMLEINPVVSSGNPNRNYTDVNMENPVPAPYYGNPFSGSLSLKAQPTTLKNDKFSTSRSDLIKIPVKADKSIEDFHTKMTEVFEITVREIKSKGEGSSSDSIPVVHLSRIASDHKLILFTAENKVNKKSKDKHFIFEHYWMDYNELETLISEKWNLNNSSQNCLETMAPDYLRLLEISPIELGKILVLWKKN
ncbi:hypothetical protein Cni_G13356 [Canna indica]|uniref:Uncharacterized protein n=1 Tax=Canna indica TaxID=4628 RepID=A0AAQ3QBF5_9LILI|nr:hypothetical protein Cni_G13356 [Canna indica]